MNNCTFTIYDSDFPKENKPVVKIVTTLHCVRYPITVTIIQDGLTRDFNLSVKEAGDLINFLLQSVILCTDLQS